jgi:hypothetical protein
MAFIVFSLPESGDKIFRGDHIVLNGAISQQQKPVNLTDYQIWFTAKPDISSPDGASGVIQKTVGNGITVVDTAEGIIRITLVPADTAGINQATTYQCDIQVKSPAPANEVSTVGRGTIAVEIDVTRAT